jgi:hypothetical protein
MLDKLRDFEKRVETLEGEHSRIVHEKPGKCLNFSMPSELWQWSSEKHFALSSIARLANWKEVSTALRKD